MKKKVLALDIGVKSLGWAISGFDDQKNEWDILDFGVRLWDAPEDSKTLKTNSEQRRITRSSRRLNRRRKNRIKDLKWYLQKQGIISKEEIKNHFLKINQSGNNFNSMQKENNPLVLRYRGLREEINSLQLFLCLLNFIKYRGYNNKFEFDNLNLELNVDNLDKDAQKEDKKNKALLAKGDKKIQKYQFPINYIFSKESDIKKIKYHNKSISKKKINQEKEQLKKRGYLKEEIEKILATYEKINKISFFLNDEDKSKDVEKSLREEIEKVIEEFSFFVKKNNFSELKIKKISEFFSEFKKNMNENFILFYRKHFKNEAQTLLSKQAEFNPTLTDEVRKEIIKIIFRQRDFEDGPGPLEHDQRLWWEEFMKKSNKKHLLYKNFLAYKGKCRFFPDHPRVSTLSIEADIYFILRELDKILGKIFDSDSNISSNIQRKQEIIKNVNSKILQEYFTKLKFNKEIIKKILEEEKLDFNKINFSGIALIPPKKTFLSKLNTNKENQKFVKKELDKINLNDLSTIKNNQLNLLGKTLEENKSVERLLKKLQEFTIFEIKDWKKWIKENSKWFTNAMMNVSREFILDSLEKVLSSGKRISVYEEEINKEKLSKKANENNFRFLGPIYDPDMQKNAVVFRAVNQVRKVLKVLYKKEEHFDYLIIEVAKDLYSEKNKRKAIVSKQLQNYDNNLKIERWLSDKNLKLNSHNRELLKLFEITDGPGGKKDKLPEKKFIYDFYDINIQAKICIDDLFDGSKVEVDHIIPYSRLNDNTLNNKILTTKANNASKGNKTPIEWFRFIEKSEIEIKKWKEKIEKIFSKKANNNLQKLEYLLSESFERNHDFESKDINDTRYITKYILNYLKMNLNWKYKDDKNKPQILPIQGRVTSNFRRLWLNPNFVEEQGGSYWGVSFKNRNLTPFHHAIDAMVMLNLYNKGSVEFYQSMLRYYDYYNFLVEKNKNREFIKSELAEFHEKLIKQIERKDFYKSEFSINYYKERLVNIYNNLINSIDNMKDLFYKSFVYDLQSNRTVYPIIKKFAKKVNDLIPIKVELVDISNWIVNEKDEMLKNQKILKLKGNDLSEAIVSPKEWAQKNNRSEKNYPYVSYKVSLRARGNIFDQNPLSKDKKKKNGERIITDKRGNSWLPNKYCGLAYNKENKKWEKISYYQIQKNCIEKKAKIDLLIYRNLIFENKNQLFCYKGMHGLRIYVSHPNLTYPLQEFSNFKIEGKKITPNFDKKNSDISFPKIDTFKPFYVNLLGKKE